MQKEYRLRKRNHFQQVYKRGKSVSNRHLVLLHTPGRQLQVGISVSKKLGNAVARNLVKRRLRECFRKELPTMKTGRYVLIAREPAAGTSYQELHAALCNLLFRGKYTLPGTVL